MIPLRDDRHVPVYALDPEPRRAHIMETPFDAVSYVNTLIDGSVETRISKRLYIPAREWDLLLMLQEDENMKNRPKQGPRVPVYRTERGGLMHRGIEIINNEI